MGTSRIEQLIDDIYEFIEGCKMQPLSSTKVIVPKDEMYDLLDELRLRTPDEIKHYQKIISNREAILADAEQKAGFMLKDAQEKMDVLVDEHEIMQQAYSQANQIVQQAVEQAEEILASAQNDAEQIRQGAIVYTSDMLGSLENILDKAYNDSREKYEGLLTSIRENLDIVQANHRELTGESTSLEKPVYEEQQEIQETTQGTSKVIKHEEIIDDYALSDEY